MSLLPIELPPDASHPSGLIHRILEPALQFWLRSQVESVEALQVQVDSGDRQLLSGHISQVRLEAQQVVYQGLCLHHVKLVGHRLQVNLGQILKGKPLNLLEPVAVDLSVQLRTIDVQASLDSPLLQKALIDALQALVGEQIENTLGDAFSTSDLTLQNPVLVMSVDQLRFSAQLVAQPSQRSVPVSLQTGLTFSGPNTLVLNHPEWLPTPQARRGLPLHDLHGYTFDLGPQVQVQHCSITADGIEIQGQLMILP